MSSELLVVKDQSTNSHHGIANCWALTTDGPSLYISYLTDDQQSQQQSLV